MNDSPLVVAIGEMIEANRDADERDVARWAIKAVLIEMDTFEFNERIKDAEAIGQFLSAFAERHQIHLYERTPNVGTDRGRPAARRET